MLFILSSSIANPIVEIPLSDIFDDYPQMLHAESTICGHKIMAVTGILTFIVMMGSTSSFIAINILTTSPLNVAGLILGVFCVATRGLEANYDVVMFLSSGLFFTIITVIQSFNNLFYYQDLSKLPSCQTSNSEAFSNPFRTPGHCSNFEWNGGMIFFFVLIFIGNAISVIFFPVFAFLVIKLSLDQHASEARRPRRTVATTTVRPRFFENLPALTTVEEHYGEGSRRTSRYHMNNLIVALLSIPILAIARFFALSVPYTNQGFFCDDDDIRYPNRSSTVSSDLMQVIYFSIMIIVIPLSEISLSLRHGQGLRKILNRQVVMKTLFFYAAYVCGVLANSLATTLFKRTSGRLRPNFIAVCQPKDLNQLCPLGSNAFIEDFVCLGDDRPDEHFSFPSSHASHSLYFATFSILYLHRRFRFPNVVRGFFQYTIFLIAVWICLSRVRDFKHRYEDVAGGGLLGIVMGIGMIHLVLFNFKHHRYEHHDHYEGLNPSQEEQKHLYPKYDATSSYA